MLLWYKLFCGHGDRHGHILLYHGGVGFVIRHGNMDDGDDAADDDDDDDDDECDGDGDGDGDGAGHDDDDDGMLMMVVVVVVVAAAAVAAAAAAVAVNFVDESLNMNYITN